MYSKMHKPVANNTKYTSYIQKLNEDHLKEVNKDSNSIIIPKTKMSDTTTNKKPPDKPKSRNTPPKTETTKHEKPATKSKPISKIISTKFADHFSPEESNALKTYLEKANSAPNISPDMDNSTLSADDVDLSDISNTSLLRRQSADQTHLRRDVVNGRGMTNNNDNSNPAFNNKLRTSSESIANIVYSSIRNDATNTEADELTANLPTGSDSKQDYDPTEPLENSDQVAMRNELLNNIRAISRATYFEDVYTGKVPPGLDNPEQEVMALLQHSQARNPSDNTNLEVKDDRVDTWVRDSVENSNIADPPEMSEFNVSTYHESVWNGDTSSKKQFLQYPNMAMQDKRPYSFSSDNLANTGLKMNDVHVLPSTKFVRSNRGKSRQYFENNRSNPNNKLQSQFRAKDLTLTGDTSSFSEPNSFSRHVNSNDFVNEQVQHRLDRMRIERQEYMSRTLPVRQSSHYVIKRKAKLASSSENDIARHYNKIPKIYQRQNMELWRAKKVWFYMNGEDKLPRFEYRFRPRDLPNMDALLNLLTKKMPQLPLGK